MNHHLIPFALLFAFTSHANAVLLTCEVDEPTIGPRKIAIDTDKRSARYVDLANKEHLGEVTFVRKHDQGLKLNMSFVFPDQDYGISRSEYMLFTSDWKTYRLVGVGFAEFKGKEHLTQLLSNSAAQCTVF